MRVTLVKPGVYLPLIIASNRFDAISANKMYGLGCAFGIAAKQGQLQCLNAIIACKRFREITASGELGLGASLVEAAQYGNLECVRAIMTCNRFNEISSSQAAHAFLCARNAGHQEVARVLGGVFKKEETCVIL